MQIEIKKCSSCGIETNKRKQWGTGAWLCDKCYDEWNEEDKKMRGDEFSVSKSLIKKGKKEKMRRNKKKVVTKIHENGSQSRLTMFDDKE